MTKRIVKGILIDPFACTVTEVEHDASGIEDIYKLISHESMPVSCFTCAYSNVLAPGDAIFVDDEALFKNPDRFFLFPGNHPLAGKGLILGSNKKGNTVSAGSSLSCIESRILFLQATIRVQDEVCLEATTKPWVAEQKVHIS